MLVAETPRMVAAPEAVVLYEEADRTPPEQVHAGTQDTSRFVAVPFTRLARDSAGTPLAKNIVALGILGQLFGRHRSPALQSSDQLKESIYAPGVFHGLVYRTPRGLALSPYR